MQAYASKRPSGSEPCPKMFVKYRKSTGVLQMHKTCRHCLPYLLDAICAVKIQFEGLALLENRDFCSDALDILHQWFDNNWVVSALHLEKILPAVKPYSLMRFLKCLPSSIKRLSLSQNADLPFYCVDSLASQQLH